MAEILTSKFNFPDHPNDNFVLKDAEARERLDKVSPETEARLRATVGHSCKNLLEITTDSLTSSGITYVVDKIAGTVTANGTSTAQSALAIYFNIKPGKYYINGCPSDRQSSSCDVYMWDATNSERTKMWNGVDSTPSDIGEDKQEMLITDGTHLYSYNIRIPSGKTVTNMIFKPMIWDGAILDDTFEPYIRTSDSSVQDLTQSQIEFVRNAVGYCSKNLCDLRQAYVYQAGGANISHEVNVETGEVQFSGAPGTSNYIFVCQRYVIGTDIPAGDYYISGCPDGGSTDSYYVYVYDSTASARPRQINGVTGSQQVCDSTTSNSVKLIDGHTVTLRILIRPQENVTYTNLTFKPMLRSYSIKDDTFEPYVQPTDERIELVNRTYLESTVGHSEETNLFVQQFRQGTSANTSTATAVCSLTVIPVEYNQTLYFHNENTNFSFRVYGTNDEGKDLILAGGTLDQAHRLYEGSYVYTPNLKLKNETQGVTCYVIMVRKPNFPLADPVTYQNITPSDIPQNMIWVTNEQRTDDRIVDLEARVAALEAIINGS